MKKIKETTKDLISKTKSAYYITKDSIQKLGEETVKSRNIYSLDEFDVVAYRKSNETNFLKSLTIVMPIFADNLAEGLPVVLLDCTEKTCAEGYGLLVVVVQLKSVPRNTTTILFPFLVFIGKGLWR